MIATATGVEPLFIGKPSEIIIERVLQKMGCSKEDALIVGDNYDTDIKAGFNSKVDQLLVTTGITQPDDIVDKKQPTILVDDLDEVEL